MQVLLPGKYNMKYYFLSFQSIDNNKAKGMVKFLEPILKKINSNNSIIYYVSSAKNYNGLLNILEVSPSFKFISKVISFLYHRVSIVKKISYGKVRLLQEQLFDYFFSLKITKPIILVSSAYLLKSVQKNKKLGGINIFIAGNPDDREIYKIMESEQSKYNIQIKDAYTYTNRIDFISKTFDSFDHIITFTQSEIETFSKNIDNKKISFLEAFIVPNKKTFENISYEKNKKITFCYIAHTVWLKGLIYLVDAFSKIEGNNAQLLIGGTINKQVLQYIKSNGLESKNIKLVGHVSDLNKFLRTSHVCIVPSLLDAGPATVAEALYCGLPVITTEGCGSKVLINDGENGFVVPVADSEALVKKIEWFISNNNEIEMMSINAVESIKTIENSDHNELFANHILAVIDKLKIEKGIE
jgi:glycosyltransferase involved in cell wall biosynthesis